MTMTKTRWIQVVCLLLVGLGAKAASAAFGWSPSVKVQKTDLETHQNFDDTPASFFLTFTPPVSNACSSAQTGYWLVVGDADMQKAILATATAAKNSGAAVKVLFNSYYQGVDSCTQGPKTGYPKLRGLEIQ